MTNPFSRTLMVCVLFGSLHDLVAIDAEQIEPPGLKSIRLLTDASSIHPGETITVGLLLDPLPGHHTYWRGPGIVGVATQMDWTLPPGFSVGKTIWPPPREVLMAGIVANGYTGPALLLTEITAPATIEGAKVTLSVRCSWMACSTSCNPGIADLALALPVTKGETATPPNEVIQKQFEEVRQSAPKLAPSDWSFEPRLPAPDRIELNLVIPGFDPANAATLRFFCHDMQVDSDEPQTITVTDPAKGAIRVTLVRPEFAPTKPESLSGVFFCPGGWPGLDTSHIEFSAPWPASTFSHE